MKKQHLYRVAAILLFLCIFLGIMPRHALQATAAENDSLPKEGVLYTLSCTDSKKQVVSLEFFIGGVISIEKNLGGSLRLSWNDAPDVKNLGCAFLFEEVQDGYYIIIPAAAPGFCLQVYLENERKTVYGSKFDNKPEQLWTITPFEGGIQISNAAVPDLVLGLSDDRPINVHMTTGEWVFKLEESQIVFPEHRIHVKAPDFWAPGTVYKSSTIVFMPREDDGWYSWYNNGKSISIENLAISSPMAQVLPPDFSIGVQTENPNQDYWVVITDDPNVEGDLTYKVYDYNPDDEPLKPGQAYSISIGWPLSIMPEKGLQGTNLMVGGQGDLSFSFYFDKTKDGYYTISPASMPGWQLQLSEGKIITEKPQDIPEQKWSIVACDDGYTISSAADPTLFIGKTTPPADHNQESGDLVLSAEPDHKVWRIRESPLAFSKHSVYAKAPEHWAPGLVGDYGSWCVGIMEKQADGWFSFPLYPYQPEYYSCQIVNYMVDAWSSQYGAPDSNAALYRLEPDKDYWVVITDDPNVDGDLTYKVYDYNPDEEPPKTADPMTLTLPAFGLLTSAVAIFFLLRRRRCI